MDIATVKLNLALAVIYKGLAFYGYETNANAQADKESGLDIYLAGQGRMVAMDKEPNIL